MMADMTYTDALSKAEHLIAVGQDTVHLYGDDVPWVNVDAVEVGSGYRLNGPVGCYLIVHQRGLTLKWSLDFEERDANGRGVSMFDRARLRDAMARLMPKARRELADLLQEKVLPAVEKHTAEIREALQRQWDSEDCVRGLIEYARERGSER